MDKINYYLLSILLFVFLVQCNTSDSYDVNNFTFSSVVYFPKKEIVSDSIFISKANNSIFFVKSFYSDGELAKEYFTRNGELQGICKAYGEAGRIFAIIEYDRGKKISEKIIKD